MSTNFQCFNLILDNETAEILNILAKKDPYGSVSSIANKLIQQALEINEDAYFCKIAESRKGEETISHEEFWK